MKMTREFSGLADRIVWKTAGEGLPVPWPEELCIGSLVYQKDYRMNAFPQTPDGDIWHNIPDEKYLSWLADYLINNLPELSPEQEKILASRSNDNAVVSCFWIGDLAGWYENEAQSRPDYDYPFDFSETGDFSSVKLHDGGFSYEEYVDCWKDTLDPGESLLTEEELILNEYGWYLAIEEEKNAFKKYWPDFCKAESYSMRAGSAALVYEPPDAGWRVYLALALQVLDSKEKRIKGLEEFYHAWHEMMGK